MIARERGRWAFPKQPFDLVSLCSVRKKFGEADHGFIAKGPQSKIRNISRKDAKAAKKIVLQTWRSSRLGASKSPFHLLRQPEKFAQAAATLKHNSTKGSEIITFRFSYFVRFESFVVKSLSFPPI
jgi:hypothetical protein